MRWRPDTYGRAFADVYDAWYEELSDADETARAVVDLAKTPGLIIELGSGTGRLTAAVQEELDQRATGTPGGQNRGYRVGRGHGVVGIDASPAMLGRSSMRPTSTVGVAGDMAALPIAAATASVVYCAWNTFFNLDTPEAQQRCVAEVARVLGPGGALAIEAFVPSDARAASSGHHLDPARTSADSAVLMATYRDPAGGSVVGTHLDFRGDGVRVRPWRILPTAPDALDRMTAAAGFVLADRWRTWRREPWQSGDERHVTIWRRGLSSTG